MSNLRENLIIEFQTLTQEEKHEKIMIYLYKMYKSNPNFIGIYSIFEQLGPENIEAETLDQIYTTLVDISLIWKDYEESWLGQITSLLKDFKENIQKEKESQDILESIENF